MVTFVGESIMSKLSGNRVEGQDPIVKSVENLYGQLANNPQEQIQVQYDTSLEAGKTFELGKAFSTNYYNMLNEMKKGYLDMRHMESLLNKSMPNSSPKVGNQIPDEVITILYLTAANIKGHNLPISEEIAKMSHVNVNRPKKRDVRAIMNEVCGESNIDSLGSFLTKDRAHNINQEFLEAGLKRPAPVVWSRSKAVQSEKRPTYDSFSDDEEAEFDDPPKKKVAVSNAVAVEGGKYSEEVLDRVAEVQGGLNHVSSSSSSTVIIPSKVEKKDQGIV
jgi:hypothetical protein